MCPKAVFLYLLQAKSIQKLSSTSIIEKRVHVFKQTVIFQATNYITIQRACRKIFSESYAKKSKKTIYASQFKRIHSNLFTFMRLQLRHDNILLGKSQGDDNESPLSTTIIHNRFAGISYTIFLLVITQASNKFGTHNFNLHPFLSKELQFELKLIAGIPQDN